MTSEIKKNQSISRLWKHEFKFVSPMSLDSCVDNLTSRDEREGRLFGGRNKLVVKIKSKTPDEYSFRLHRNTGKNMKVTLRGTLTKWDENSTLVKGYRQLGLFSLISLIVVYFVLFLVFLQAGSEGGMPNFFVFLFIFSFVSIFGVRFVEGNRLTKVVYDTLSDQIY